MSSAAVLLPAQPASRADPRAVARWLLVVAAMVFAMVVVGGITRLTESGLSMVRWEPIRGIVPPLDPADWAAEFAAYRASPEGSTVNRNISLAEFKTIYFWEYVHRVLGRLIGLVFALPLAWFAARRVIPAGYGPRLILLFALGGLQGAIGWWMVASGLVDRPEVSHLRLSVHLLTALLILALAAWTALDLFAQARDPDAPRARLGGAATAVLALLSLQILFGAWVAGLDAGHAFNTWPLMGDRLYPDGAPVLEPALRNLRDNPITVQFVHRWLAIAVAAAVLAYAVRLARHGLRREAALAGGLTLLQVAGGIATLLSGVQLHLAVAHQANAALVLLVLVWAAHRDAERAGYPATSRETHRFA